MTPISQIKKIRLRWLNYPPNIIQWASDSSRLTKLSEIDHKSPYGEHFLGYYYGTHYLSGLRISKYEKTKNSLSSYHAQP